MKSCARLYGVFAGKLLSQGFIGSFIPLQAKDWVLAPAQLRQLHRSTGI